MNIILKLLVQCDTNIDLNLCIYVSALYFMVWWFCLISVCWTNAIIWKWFHVMQRFTSLNVCGSVTYISWYSDFVISWLFDGLMYWFSVTQTLNWNYICRSLTYISWSSDFALYLEDYLMSKCHNWNIVCLFVCVEVLRPCQQLRSCRASQLPINTFPGQYICFSYHIMGYFRVAKLSRFCLKNMGLFFADFNFRSRQCPRKIISLLFSKKHGVDGTTRLSLDRSTVRPKYLKRKWIKDSCSLTDKQIIRTYLHSDSWIKWCFRTK